VGYLRYLVNYYEEDLEVALAAYNGGMGNVDKAIEKYGRENFMQGMSGGTRQYVPIVLAKRDKYVGYDPRR
jgi:soluble lytic murein transglycosylase-like protein